MYKNKNEVYRILLNTNQKYNNQIWCNVPNAIAPTIKSEIPEIREAVRMVKYGFGDNASVSYDEKSFVENNFYFVDSNFLKIFNIPLSVGDPQRVLSKPNSVIVSKSIARKLFGNINPVGKSIKVGRDLNLEVTGVFYDIPHNSTIDCDIIANFQSGDFGQSMTWDNASFETYCLLYPNSNITKIEKKINSVVKSHTDSSERWYRLSLQPLKDVHLFSASYKYTYSSRIGDIAEVRNLGFLAILVLLIASINFVNITTASSQNQTKEANLHKTFGATSGSMVLRFYIEIALETFFALMIGIIFTIITLPLFNFITQKSITYQIFFNSHLILLLFLLWFILTSLTGLYPALLFSNRSPAQINQLKIQPKGFAGYFRKALVIFQFTASALLIIAVFTIRDQMKYVERAKLGYNPENVIAININSAQTIKQLIGLTNDLKSQSNVISICAVQGFPGKELTNRTLYKNGEDHNGIPINTCTVGNGSIVNTLQLKLLAGKDIPAMRPPGDTDVDVLINMKAADYLGLTPQQAVGRKIDLHLGKDCYVDGVVGDFNFKSFKSAIGPFAFHNDREAESKNYILVRFVSNNLSRTTEEFGKIFRSNIPSAAFNYTFIDEFLRTLYSSEKVFEHIILVFSLFAILIACLGLFGLTAFIAEQRTKEMGIRKTLGATGSNIFLLFVSNFLKPVFLGFLIACPLAWLLMSDWLNGFAYRINLSFAIFVETGLIILLIGFITVSFQSLDIAQRKPAKSLKRR